jgi:hypothetical protein
MATTAGRAGGEAMYSWGSQLSAPYGMMQTVPTINLEEFRQLQRDVAFLGQGFSQVIQKMAEVSEALNEIRASAALDSSSRQRSPSIGPEQSTPSRDRQVKRMPKVEVSTNQLPR